MIFNLGWEKDLKLKLRFLELMFLLTTILIATKSSIGSTLGSGLLSFLVFGSLYYFILANGIMKSKVIIPLSLLTGFSLSAVFSSVFVGLNTLELSQGLAYGILLGVVFSFGIMPKRIFIGLLRKI
ncbi:hypothetical protein [Candidatus Nanohalovita haloferacivicina]|uniref:hypothetical protein n=1 Tax=Candidatus Nanohalovita haloferacivicina TaxID=2978046 RepID=UPI00325FB6E9|nr:hypothetical protein HBNXNv_0711 [Candidatus Nanohalobia archaeon BNXNv]